MKALLGLAILCALAVPGSLPGWAGPFARARESQVMGHLQKALKLSDEQKESIQPILMRAMEEFKGLPAGEQKKLIQKTLRQISPILNSTQRHKLLEFLDLLKGSLGEG